MLSRFTSAFDSIFSNVYTNKKFCSAFFQKTVKSVLNAGTVARGYQKRVKRSSVNNFIVTY
jgi:hypothetical protein